MEALILVIVLIVGLVVSHGSGPIVRPFGQRRKFLEPDALLPRRSRSESKVAASQTCAQAGSAPTA
jgi:hypothetical protein